MVIPWQGSVAGCDLHTHVVVLVLTPAILVNLLLDVFFIIRHCGSLRHRLRSTNTDVVRPLTISARCNVDLRGHRSVNRLVDMLRHHRSSVIHTVSICSRGGQLFIASGFRLSPSSVRLNDGIPFPHRLAIAHSNSVVVLHAPVVSRDCSPSRSPDDSTGGDRGVLKCVTLRLSLGSIHLRRCGRVFVSDIVVLFYVNVTLVFN